MIVDIEPGMVTIRNAEAILGISNDLTLTPNQTRLVAMRLMHKGGAHRRRRRFVPRRGSSRERKLK